MHGCRAVAPECAGGYQGSPTDTVRDILDKRYALGEIGRAEYEEKKKDLGIG